MAAALTRMTITMENKKPGSATIEDGGAIFG